jgi:hypothetical protein
MAKRFLSILLVTTLALGGAAVSSIALAGTASATTTPVANYVTHLYQSLLNRTPGTGELQGWDAILTAGPPFASANGSAATMLAVTTDFVTSSEYLSDVVSADYTTYLHRSPDAGGLATWTGALEAGVTEQSVEEQLLATSEYYSSRGTSNFDTWLTAVYSDVLNRTVDPGGRTTWDAAHTAGATDLAIATSIVTSPEAQSDVVAGLYTTLLNRPATASDLTYWTAQIQAGTTHQKIVALITSSPEYYADSQLA